jgi:hypothetical protein
LSQIRSDSSTGRQGRVQNNQEKRHFVTCKCNGKYHHLQVTKVVLSYNKMTRMSRARPTAEHQVENAARRNQVQKSIANAQQEEAFGELLNLLIANGGKVPYGAVGKLIKS